jgi:hypothetical protein
VGVRNQISPESLVLPPGTSARHAIHYTTRAVGATRCVVGSCIRALRAWIVNQNGNQHRG